MTDIKVSEIKIQQIYIINEDAAINFKHIEIDEEDLRMKIKEFLNDPKFINEELKIIRGMSYLTLETLNIIDKNCKEYQKLKKANLTIKKLNKERLATIFKCLGFNIIYCLQIAENIFNVISNLILLKTEYEKSSQNDYVKSKIIIKRKIFEDLSKYVIKTLTGSKCRIRKYFDLSYLIISKIYFI